jgi:negative regulator of flagellin synthesis FlgM
LKIERSPASVALVAESGIKAKKAENVGVAAEPSVVAKLKHAQVSSADDIDMAKVNEIREAIANGTLSFDPSRIADGLLKSMRELG